ncbi:MAG: DUF58 domain-containing protein [Candidatus Firestonebacteria bacterium]
MIPAEILKQVRRIEIRTSKLVNDIFSGQYESIFKGRGMEFSEVREYQPGDDVRTIDWNVTARYGKPYIKKFVEERELTVMLVVDMSLSGKFATYGRFKSEIITEISALLAFSAIKNNDKVGLILFTEEVEKFIPPKKGRSHILRLIREILYFQPKHTGTNIAKSLEYLNEVAKRKNVVFIISDFLNPGYERPLHITNRRHDIVAIDISDPREKKIPNIGIVELEDTETGETKLIDTSESKFRETFEKQTKELEDYKKHFFNSINVDRVKISTDKPYIKPLLAFFKEREKRFR